MKVIPINSKKYGNFEFLIDDEDFELISKYNWNIKPNIGRNTYYVRRSSYKDNSPRFLHRLILNLTDSKIMVDHINGNGLDNRKCNLRLCNNKQNQQNKIMCKNNKSGYKGVSLIKKTNKYTSIIYVDGIKIFLGNFDNKIDAAKAYNNAAISYFGEFAKLNVIIKDNS